MRTWHRLVLLAAPLAVLLVGCQSVVAGTGSGSGGSGGSGGQGQTGFFTHTTGPDDVVVRVVTGGGFVPAWSLRRTIPTFVLAGDGTAMVPAPDGDGGLENQPSIWPFRSSGFDEDRIQKVLILADQAGLLGSEVDYGYPQVTDMPSTSVQITVNGDTTTQNAYALFYTNSDDDLTSAQNAARAQLRTFISEVRDRVSVDAADYQPASIAVYRFKEDPVTANGQARPWPIATVPPPTTDSNYETCIVVDGDQATALRGAAKDATLQTAWTVDSEEPIVFVLRPMLPGDPGCDL